MVAWILVAPVHAGDGAKDPEEVVVWGDRYARWNQRWYVETELHFAEPLVLLARANQQIELAAVELRMVLSCDDDGAITPNLHEALCEIEDLGIVAMPRVRSAGDADVLHELDAALTGARVQLQVSDDGKVPDIDLEGLTTTSLHERESVESMRQLLSRAIVPFHLPIPSPVRDGMHWQELRSRLFDLPGTQGTQGGSAVTHFLDRVDPAHFVIQSIGEATVSPTVPLDEQVLVVTEVYAWWRPTGRSTPLDLYHLTYDGVAILDADTGILSERVWAVTGGITPSSPHASFGSTWYNAGRLRMLAAGERVDVGQTYVTSRPNRMDADRPAWVSLPR